MVDYLKEFKEKQSPKGAKLIMGVRAEESPRRAKAWQLAAFHHVFQVYTICPILGWTTKQVWAFIRHHDLPYCKLYDEGFDRLGCIGCPMGGARQIQRQFARWPGYEKLWRRTFQRIWEKRTGSTQRDGRQWFGDRHFESWEEMWEWWLNDDPLPGEKHDCQGLMELFS